MSSNKEHWNTIFANKSEQQLGWYEDDVSQTLKFIKLANLAEQPIMFIAGAGTSLLVDELVKSSCHIIANDISHAALEQLAQRVGSDKVDYFQHNIAQQFDAEFSVDIWLDRAVLHFLLEEEEITTYFNNLKASVKPNGYVLLAEFSKTGAKKCAGLVLHQYSITEMQARLGHDFTLIASEEHTFVSPQDQDKPYIYGLFKRSSE